MDKNKLVRKLYAYKQDPDLYKAPTSEELADLVILVLNAVKNIEDAVETKRVNIEEKYDKQAKSVLSKAENDSSDLLKQVRTEVNKLITQSSAVLDETATAIEARVQESLQNIRNGNDGIVTEEEIQRAAEVALSMLELPNFDALVTTQITSNGEALRDALELLSGENRYKVEIEDVQGLTDALNQLATIRTANGGTIGKNQVYNFIRQAIADGTISTGGSVSDEAYDASWDGVTDEAPSKNAVYDKIQSLVLEAGAGDVVGPASTTDDRIATFDGETGKLIQDGGKTVAEVLSTDNHTDGTTNKVYTAIEKTKLAGIEAGADVTDTTNVTAAGALMDSEVANLAAVKSFNPSNYAAASHNHTGVYEPAKGTDDNYVTDAEKAALHSHSNKATLDNITAAYTTAEASKLAGIEAGAEVNNISDVNATDLTDGGDTTLHTHSAYALSGHNHSGVYEPADATILKSAAIGVSVAAQSHNHTGVYAPVLGADDNYVTDAEKTAIGTIGNKLNTADIDDTPVNGETAAPISSNWAFDHAALSSGTSTAAHIKTSTNTTVNTGSATDEAVTPDALAGSYAGTKSVQLWIVAEATDVDTTSGVAYIRGIPEALNGMNLVRATAQVATAGTTNATTIQVRNLTKYASNDSLSSAISIASGGTVATAGTINTSYDDVSTDDVIKVYVTGQSTTKPKGLWATLEYRLP